jgi:CRISPR type III-B/RAMP module RAMP protein Cmr1
MHEYLDIRLELLSPAFVAGADQKAAEITGGTVKGLMRWWWRSLVGHECDLQRLREREAALVGSADEKRAAASPLRIQIRNPAFRFREPGTTLPQSKHQYAVRGRNQDALPYLAYGPVSTVTKDDEKANPSTLDAALKDRAGRPKTGLLLRRRALDAGTLFTLRLSWREGALTAGQRAEIIKAAASWVTLGGIGARSRKGFGALDGRICEASPGLLESATAIREDQQSTLLKSGKQWQKGALPQFPQIEYRIVRLQPTQFPAAEWHNALGDLAVTYRSLRHADSGKWITGYAKPSKERRASSLLLTLVREKDQLRGVICLLPCQRLGKATGDRDQQELQQFAEAFDRIMASAR